MLMGGTVEVGIETMHESHQRDQKIVNGDLIGDRKTSTQMIHVRTDNNLRHRSVKTIHTTIKIVHYKKIVQENSKII